MVWRIKPFYELTNDELYGLLKLRIDVFVVEQKCYYADLDELDRHPKAQHLFLEDENRIIAYLRALPPNLVYPGCAAIGRVATSSQNRNTGLGKELLQRGIELCDQQWPDVPIKIAAQEYLKNYYARQGFVPISDSYMEDGIPHIDMLRDVKT